MSDTIDKRIVEMAFENDKFEKGVGTSLGTIDKLKKSLNFDNSAKSLSGLNDAASRVNLSHIANGVQNISNHFSAMGVLAITTLANIANSAYQAGVRIVKALTIDPIKAGLNEYETKLNSVQTILANTQKEGTTLKVVTDALNQLNEYSDKTIYNFQQMTRNVGTFTAAGVKLETSVAAIKGIANLAAISGSNADQASTAMYQLSQALSSGTVKLMDWNSVVNAGMGGQVFQDAVKETARLHGVAIDEMVEQEGSFRETLHKGWFTSEILTETLAKFTGDLNADQLRTMGYTEEQITSIIKMGQTANDAATKVKTFTQLFDTLKEAAQSGWAQTWEILIGDFEEAKLFLTDLNNWFGGILGATADARNGMLQGWKDLGGRTKLLESVKNILNAIVLLVNPISEAFREFFPATTSQQLLDITEGLRKFTERLSLSSENADKVKRIFKGVFAFLDIGKIAISSLIKAIFGLSGSFDGLGTSLLDNLAKFGDWLVQLRTSVIKSEVLTTIFENIATVLKATIGGVIGFFSALIGGFSSTEKIAKSDSLSKFLEELGSKFKSFGKIGVIVSKVFGLLSKLVEKLGPVVKKVGSVVGDLMNKLLDALTRGLDKLDISKILDIFNTGLLGGLFLSVKSFVENSKGLVGSGMFGGILLSIKSFIDNGGSMFTGVKGILDSVKSSLDSYQKTLKANTLFKIAGAIALLAVSIIALAMVDQTKLIGATAAIGAMFVGLSTTLNIFEKTTGSGSKLLALTGSILGISLALLILAGAIVTLSKLDVEEVAQGTLAIGAVLALLVAFQKYSSTNQGMVGAITGIFGLSLAMMALSLAIKSLGSMDTETLAKGLLAMGIAIGMISIGLKSMTTAMTGAASLLIASASILVLAVALKALGSLSLEQIGIGLLAIAGTLTILGIAGALLTPVAPTIAIIAISLLAIGAAAGAFGLAILGIGVGLGALAVGIVTLAGLSSAGIATITLVISGLAALLPMIATQIAKGITNLIIEIGKNGIKIGKALANIGLEMLKSFAELIPEVVDIVLKFVLTLLTKLEEYIPKIVETGYAVMIGFLEGVRTNLPKVIELTTDIITSFLDGLAAGLPKIIDSGWKLLISFIDGMTASVEANLPTLMLSTQALGIAIVQGVVEGLIQGRDAAWEGVKELGRTILDGFKSFFGINSPSTVFIELALQLINGLVQGFKANVNLVLTSVIDLGNRIIDKIKEKVGDMSSAGRDLVSGFAQGISNYIGTAVDAAANLAASVLAKVKSVMDSNSPSKKMIAEGKNIDDGLAIGITQFSGVVAKSVNTLGTDTLSAFGTIMSNVTDSIDTNMEFSPSIRPIVDLSEIQSSGVKIQSLLGGATVSVGLASVTAKNIAQTESMVDPNADISKTPDTKAPITFNQYNNSPKELSRFEIYRQTKNQLLQLKGVGGIS